MLSLLTRTLTYLSLSFSLCLGVIYYRFASTQEVTIDINFKNYIQHEVHKAEILANVGERILENEFNELNGIKSKPIVAKVIIPKKEILPLPKIVTTPVIVKSAPIEIPEEKIVWPTISEHNEFIANSDKKIAQVNYDEVQVIQTAPKKIFIDNPSLDSSDKLNTQMGWKKINGIMEIKPPSDVKAIKVSSVSRENQWMNLAGNLKKLKAIKEEVKPVPPPPVKAPVVNAVVASVDKNSEEEPEFFSIVDEEPETIKEDRVQVSLAAVMKKEKAKEVKKNPYVITKKKVPYIAMNTSGANGASKSSIDYPVADYSEKRKNSKNSQVQAQESIQIYKPLSVSDRVTALVSYQIRDRYTAGVVKSDNGSGEVEVSELIGSKFHLKTMTIETTDHLTTNADVPVEPGEVTIELPVLSQKFMEKMGLQTGIDGRGFILVELDEKTKDAKLDNDGNIKICLNQDFQKTTTRCSYLLFANVLAGNRNLMTAGVMNTERLIHVIENEVSFDLNLFEKAKPLNIKFLSRNLLSSEPTNLNIASKDAVLFFNNKEGRKLSNNNFIWNDLVQNIGERIYIKLTHLGEPVYVGVDSSTEVEIPDESYMRKVIKEFNVNTQSGSCIAQINFKGKVKQVDVGLDSHMGSQIFQVLYLDKDGNFYESPSEKTEKIFLLGENTSNEALASEGKFSVKITHGNNSITHLMSYCSPDTYLVEQL